jgi:putative ABC transport system substrate-binding protein
MTSCVRRREFITLLGGAAAWPVVARAQQGDRVRRIGVFMSLPPEHPLTQSNSAALLQGLQELSWTVGRNVQLDWRWYSGDAERMRKDAEELVALAPDVIMAVGGGLVLPALRQTGRAIPIVFTGTNDPVGAGHVESLARPGGNMTGFSGADYSIGPKWLQLLKEIAPGVTRALVFRTFGGSNQFFGAIQGLAPTMGVELRPIDPSNPGEFERIVTEFARTPNGGLIITASSPAAINSKLIIALAARHRLPAVYPSRYYVVSGGLISYGSVRGDEVRRAVGYVDRILKGEKPGDLPVQAPTKFELVLNMKTAKALGIEVPPTLFARADEVLE